MIDIFLVLLMPSSLSEDQNFPNPLKIISVARIYVYGSRSAYQ